MTPMAYHRFYPAAIRWSSNATAPDGAAGAVDLAETSNHNGWLFERNWRRLKP